MEMYEHHHHNHCCYRYILLSEACVEGNICVDVFMLLEDRLMSNKHSAGSKVSQPLHYVSLFVYAFMTKVVTCYRILSPDLT